MGSSEMDFFTSAGLLHSRSHCCTKFLHWI
jgi:hypothetical protein